MIKKKIKRLAIIPARSGSKRIKNKNTKNFLGKPMIFYSINSAKKSKLFNKIHVSTDDLKIKRKIKNLGLNIDFLRPKFLSKDKVGLNSVLNYVIKEYEKLNEFFDEVWLIYACAPLMLKDDLINASKSYQKTDKKYPLMSVREYDAPIEWAFEKDGNKFHCINEKKRYSDSKSLKKKFFNCANFEIYQNKDLVKKSKFFKFYGYVMPRSRSVDIDNNDDWNIAKALYLVKKK